MAELFTGLDPGRIAANLERVRERIAATGRDPAEVEVLAAGKYVPAEELPALAEAGIALIGENRAQDLLAKQEAHRDLFEWDFIGALQSRKVKDVAPAVRLIHSLASDSALRKLETHPAREVLVQVNVAGDEDKEGIALRRWATSSLAARCWWGAWPRCRRSPRTQRATDRTSPGWPSWPPSTG